MNPRVEEGRAYEGERAYVVKAGTPRSHHRPYLQVTKPLTEGAVVWRLIEEVPHPTNYPYPTYHHTTFRHLDQAWMWHDLTHQEQ